MNLTSKQTAAIIVAKDNERRPWLNGGDALIEDIAGAIDVVADAVIARYTQKAAAADAFEHRSRQLHQRVRELEQERETWGNEFAAVCAMKAQVEKLRAASEDVRARLEALVSGACHSYEDEVASALRSIEIGLRS